MRYLPLLLAGCWSMEEHTVRREIRVEDGRRTYLLHVPPNVANPAPVVLAFHGGGGDGRGMERLSGLSALSDREGFIVVYPDGRNRHWSDGRGMSDADDVGFVVALLDALAKEHAIDAERVYATGISNGAIFSHYLAAKRPDRIAAIAPVVGGLAEGVEPTGPVAVLIIQGTDDPLVPYDGGAIAGGRGRIVSTERAVEKWAAANGCSLEKEEDDLPDRDRRDGCRAHRLTWKGDVPVTLVRIDGGGHTWPSGSQYLPKFVIGPVCRDFDSELIWEFFRANPKKR
jgi:polyhydroxybutyrate depolymerase